MPTQNVNLTPELEAFVKDQVASGHFNNASEVHRAALSAMAREEEERQLRLARLRTEIQKGLEDVEAGRVVELEDDSALNDFMEDRLQKSRDRQKEA